MAKRDPHRTERLRRAVRYMLEHGTLVQGSQSRLAEHFKVTRQRVHQIVIGGLAGSFAVLAGGAAVDPMLGPLPLLLALVLFLWTPPHFWSLAIANQADYAAADVPMLPVVVGTRRAARVVFVSTIALVVASLLPGLFGAGPVYLMGALAGGAYFVHKAWVLARRPSRKTAMASFSASLLQLSLVLGTASIDGLMR